MGNDGYRLVWEDNFAKDGSIDRNKWDFDIGTGNNGWGNQQAQYYTDRFENARYEGGRLIIEARLENYGGQRFTSARLKSKSSWTYGRLQTKAKLPSGNGLWPAIWMLPKTKSYGNAYWPDNGEIDIMEQVGHDPQNIVSSVHTAEFNHMKSTQPKNVVPVSDACTNFKIYTMNWTPDNIEMFVGDENNPFDKRILIWQKGSRGWEGWPFDKNFFIVLNVAIGGYWGAEHGIDESIFPQKMEIEWIRFYEPSTGHSGIISTSTTSKAIVLQSNANNKFVCAENAGNSPLIANRDSASGWEIFDLITLNGNNVALKSHANGKYVCADNEGNGPLIANRSEIKSWETFKMIGHGNRKVSFIAVNGKYVGVDDYGRKPLIAYHAAANTWETFDLIVQ